MGGSSPESFHLTVRVCPPGTDVPAAGNVNCTSAKAEETSHARTNTNLKIMLDEAGREERPGIVRRIRVDGRTFLL